MSSKQQVLVVGEIIWAKEEMAEKVGSLADVIYVESKTRDEFKQDLESKFTNVIGIFRSNQSLSTVGPFDKEFIELLPSSVKWIAHNGAGYDPVDVHAALAKGIQVSHTPGSVDNATATTACYLILSALRQYWKAEVNVRAGKFKQGLAPAFDPENKTLGIVGMGGIGSVVAKRMALGWGMKILYHNRNQIKDGQPGSEYEYCSSLEEMLGKADVVSLNLPLNANTAKSFGEKQFAWMKDGSVLVNTARGGVVDEPALLAALKSGKLYSAGLDVFPDEPNVNPEFFSMENVILLPHMGTETRDTQKIMEIQVIDNVKSALETGKVINLVAEHKK
ncbi:2-hydroxyacid dehydrogenase [Phaffia rhodozyma]|uniref:2-hydroxyacid dehydrogenase n=1 Tax=Phaffia rhodozyma TaxID=264483 RepID=A0A0F7SIV3_PHARH|nr:2-hydroxyacid dehydrogenase [Phaffia rhodozyma]